MPGDSSIRACRYALACALADAVERGDLSRAPEALAELDRALDEPGLEPPDKQIELAAGRLLEPTHPERALQRYIAGVEGGDADEAVARARALMATSAQPRALVVSVSDEAIERVKQIATTRQCAQTSLLAAALLRQRGADLEAAELLRQAYEASSAPPGEVITQLAETLLDVDRVDEALDLVNREDPAGQDPSLALVRAQAHLIRGAFRTALQVAERLMKDTTSPTAATVRALSLVGLGRLDAALEGLPPAEVPELELARAMVRLARREYTQAREVSWALVRSRPEDPDALLVNAQAVLEALGAPPEPVPESGDPDAPAPADRAPQPLAGAEIDAARLLLAEVADQIPAPDRGSRWRRAQAATRGEDARYRFFCCELSAAMKTGPSQEELAKVDQLETTFLQDAALAEITAKRFVGLEDHESAAAAYDIACEVFRDQTIDVERASLSARAAYEQLASPRRAAECADRALAESWEGGLDPAGFVERLEFAREAIGRSFDSTEDDDLERLVNSLGWVRLRLAELTTETGVPTERALLPWLCAAIAVRPADAVLRAAVAWQLSELRSSTSTGVHAAASVFAGDAYLAAPESEYVAQIAVASAANYYGDVTSVSALLDEYRKVGDAPEWCDAVELGLYLGAGDREGIEERLDRPLPESTWALTTHAEGMALLHGIPRARPELEAALEATENDPSPAPLEAVFLAALLGRRERVADLVSAATENEASDYERGSAGLISKFAFEQMSPEEFVAGAIELARSPFEINQLVNYVLPLLVAARSGSAGPVASVPFDQSLVEARLRDFGNARRRGEDELERDLPGVSLLARLADPLAGTGRLIAAAEEAQGGRSQELPTNVLAGIGRLVMRRACDELLHRLLEAHAGIGAVVELEDIRAVIDGQVPPAKQLAIALAAGSAGGDPAGRQRAAEAATQDDLAIAATELGAALRRLRDDFGSSQAAVEDYWNLEAVIGESEEDPVASPGLRRAAAEIRSRLGLYLDQILGLTGEPWALDAPLATPIIVEVGDALVPLVDPSLDDGAFIHELIPAMRERIAAGIGVEIPGVRVAGNPELAPDGYDIRVDEVSVLTGFVAHGSFAVCAAHGEVSASDGELTDFHPLTGDPGMWVVLRAENHEAGLSRGEYLIHQIEVVLRARLARFLGPQAVNALVDTWTRQDGRDLVARVLPDWDARLRLTWILQALVTDGLPLNDPWTILSAIETAGGVTVDPRTLVRAIRTGLRDKLPGLRRGGPQIQIPEELEAALLGDTAWIEARHDFRCWLRRTVATNGRGITLVAGTDTARELVDALGRHEDRLLTTVSTRESTQT